ncbi:hypothetical protein [Candidatus Palauibacter sp.]|uniref:hypothetical protein n=1 Tax=Candidatus Palauibacter sp. TaxID=3101350 RepID=UPI003B52DC1E
MVTDEAKRVLHAFREGRSFSVDMVKDAVASDPRRVRIALERLTRLGYIVRVPFGAVDHYRLTVTGRDLGQHLADTAPAHTGISGTILPSTDKEKAESPDKEKAEGNAQHRTPNLPPTVGQLDLLAELRIGV